MSSTFPDLPPRPAISDADIETLLAQFSRNPEFLVPETIEQIEGMTAGASRVIAHANEIACHDAQSFVDPRHLLQALVEDQSGFGLALFNHFGQTEAFRQISRSRIHADPPMEVKKLPKTTLFYEVIEAAIAHTKLHDRSVVDPAHLLLGLLYVEERYRRKCQSIHIVHSLGIHPGDAYDFMLRLIGEPTGEDMERLTFARNLEKMLAKDADGLVRIQMPQSGMETPATCDIPASDLSLFVTVFGHGGNLDDLYRLRKLAEKQT